MMKRSKTLIPLIIAISLILLMSSTYSHYDSLREADFLFRGLKFEANDLEDLTFIKQSFWIFNPSLLSAQYLSDSEFNRELISSTSIFPSPDQAAAILRC